LISGNSKASIKTKRPERSDGNREQEEDVRHLQLRQWGLNYVALWNAGDKDAWVRNWKSVAPGDFRMVDPVGTPEKRGFEQCAANPFDHFQPTLKLHVAEGTTFICDNEVAWLMENRIAAGRRDDRPAQH
jgi:hypothetical protein